MIPPPALKKRSALSQGALLFLKGILPFHSRMIQVKRQKRQVVG